LHLPQCQEVNKMKKTMAVMMLLAGGLVAAPHVSVGIGFGVPAPVAVVRPICPGPGYSWVNGYYAPGGAFIAGYWAPPVGVRFAPRYYGRAPIVAHRYDRFRR
jgi:hypothetical protein